MGYKFRIAAIPYEKSDARDRPDHRRSWTVGIVDENFALVVACYNAHQRDIRLVLLR
ncbi:hypothetical protein D3C71_2163600 [compost metagenome]